MPRYHGIVLDAYNGQPLPGATVELWADGNILTALAADKFGSFIVDSLTVPDKIRISNVGFQPTFFPVPSEPVNFNLQRLETELENVTVTAKRKKSNTGLLMLLLVGVLLLTNKD